MTQNIPLRPPFTPSVGRTVHYVAPGSADGTFPTAHRAAIITDVETPGSANSRVKVCVLNPTGIFFSGWLHQDPTGTVTLTYHEPERE